MDCSLCEDLHEPKNHCAATYDPKPKEPVASEETLIIYLILVTVFPAKKNWEAPLAKNHVFFTKSS